jgi:hypothetical protein
MTMRNIFRSHTTLAATLLILGAAVAVRADGDKNGQNNNNQNAEMRSKTKLSGAAIQGKTPEGSAEFRSDARGRSRLDVEIENVNLPAGTVLQVSVVHGTVTTAVGMITLSSHFGGELELNSQDGDLVPAVQSGDMITVSNGAVMILAGVF